MGALLLHVQLDGVDRVLALSEFEDMVRAGTVGPETPVRSDALTGDRWAAAGELAFYQGLLDSPDVLLRRAWSHPGVPWFTALLVGIELRIYFWGNGTAAGAALAESGARYTPAIFERNELWRLLTYGFLHADLNHVAMNLLFLAYIGLALEGVVGTVHLAVLFFGSVFWGGALSSLLSPTTGAIGASAGDFGYLAGAAVFGLRYLELLPSRARPRFGAVMLGYGVYGLFNGIVGGEGIDNWAHLGGFLAGGFHMALLRPNVGRAWRIRNRWVSAIAMLGIILALFGAARLPFPLVPVEEDGLVAARPPWWTTGWAATGDRAWASPVTSAQLVVRTLHLDTPEPLSIRRDAVIQAYTALDPEATLGAETSVTRDGIVGTRLHLTYTIDSVEREVDAEIYVRGSYAHDVIVDAPAGTPDGTPAGASRLARLRSQIFDTLALPLPEEVRKALDEGHGGWRGLLRHAEGAAGIGDYRQAREDISRARREAPAEPVPVVRALELEAVSPSPAGVALVEEALVAFLADRRVLEAAVRALVAAGRREDALARLDARIADAPGDRRLQRLRVEISE